MPTTEEYLNSLKKDKQNIINSVKAKGVEVQDNATFTDLVGKVEGIPVGIKPEGTINITTNGVTDVTNYANANVNVSSGIEEYFDLTGLGNGVKFVDTIKKAPSYDLSKKTSLSNAFSYTTIKEAPMMETNTITNFYYTFRNCNLLEKVPLYNTSNATNMAYMFQGCSSLVSIPLFDISNVNSTASMFSSCPKLKFVPELNTIKVRDTNSMFANCYELETLPLLDLSSAETPYFMFTNCNKLKNVKGFKNLGKAYSTSFRENDGYRTFNIDCKLLTHESLMNVINNLYDIKSINVKPQQLILGSTNLAKLTADEIAIATNKGWNVS